MGNEMGKGSNLCLIAGGYLYHEISNCSLCTSSTCWFVSPMLIWRKHVCWSTAVCQPVSCWFTSGEIILCIYNYIYNYMWNANIYALDVPCRCTNVETSPFDRANGSSSARCGKQAARTPHKSEKCNVGRSSDGTGCRLSLLGLWLPLLLETPKD